MRKKKDLEAEGGEWGTEEGWGPGTGQGKRAGALGQF